MMRQRMHPYLGRGRGAVFFFTLAYIVAFSLGFIYGGNYEFAIYTVVMVAALGLMTYIIRDIDIPNGFLWALSIMGIIHMAGGGLHVGGEGERLYAYQLLDLYDDGRGLQLLKYDQLVHVLGYGVIAAAVHYLMYRALPEMDSIARASISVLVAMALGSINEMAEFFAVLILPRTGVGDYFNTMLDFSFNTLGALLGVIVYESWTRLSRRVHADLIE